MPAITRSKLGHTLSTASKSPKILIALIAVVVLAVAGTTMGYAALGKTVTLTLDGESREVRATGGTVEEVLEAEGVEVGERDQVAPGLDEKVSDGTHIAVAFARQLELVVDGEEQVHWVTSTEVADALGEIGTPFAAADLSVSRSAGIGRAGMALEVVTPKKLTVALAGKKPVRREVVALTVKDALDELGVKVDRHDETKPGLGTRLSDGDRVVWTDVRVAKKRVRGEEVGFGTVEQDDASLYEGDEEVVREGRPGTRDVTYRLVFRNGELATRKVVTATVLREPVARLVNVGTKAEPAPAAPAADYSGGSTVWDRLAQCESGGNWATNTGNGYYGGLQFSAATWASVGGSGLPHQHSREEQIHRGQILQSRAGWGQWPHCTAQLGLR